VKKANPDLVLTTVSYPIKGTEYHQRMAEQSLLLANGEWQATNDRDYRIRGRHGKSYYDFVNRWMHGELASQRLRESGDGRWLARARARARAHLGKVGMRLFAHQREA
jgi:hypothetical protein